MWFQSYDRTYKQTNKKQRLLLYIYRCITANFLKLALFLSYASFWHSKKQGRGNWLGRDNGLRKVGGGGGGFKDIKLMNISRTLWQQN